MGDAMEPKPEKKNRLSRLLGNKREKTPPPSTALPDSAYASSETPSGEAARDGSTPTTTPNQDVVPVEKNSEMANIDQGRNLAVRPATGEVLDSDTGELVTVVTTTTTTTTTTTRKPGQTPQVQKDVNQQVQETTPTAAPAIEAPSEMPANPTITEANNPTITEAKVPDRISSRPARDSPPLPMRSAARKSGEFGHRQSQASNYPRYDESLPPPTGGFYGGGGVEAPPSPSRANFSYPSRNRNSMEPDGIGLSTTHQPQQHKQSTISDLRAAAKGLHGVGETLRGTLNSAVDQNFPRKDANKAAVANAKNEEVLARGRSEMQHAKPDYQRTATGEQVVPGSWSEEELPPAGSAYAGDAERQQREERKARSIGKLFKRKPLNENEPGLRVTNP